MLGGRDGVGSEKPRRKRQLSGPAIPRQQEASAPEGYPIQVRTPGKAVCLEPARLCPGSPLAGASWSSGSDGSLVCIEAVLSLAVVPTALQKLHKCVTKNTTELGAPFTH